MYATYRTFCIAKGVQPKPEQMAAAFSGNIAASSLSNELKTWECIHANVQIIMNGFGTTLVDDKNSLEQDRVKPFLGINKRNAI